MVSQLILERGGEIFPWEEKRGWEKARAPGTEKASPHHEKTWRPGKVWPSGVCRQGTVGECRRYLRVGRALQHPVTRAGFIRKQAVPMQRLSEGGTAVSPSLGHPGASARSPL